MKIDSSNLETEKLSTLIGWSKLRGCSLMLLKGGFEKYILHVYIQGVLKLLLQTSHTDRK